MKNIKVKNTGISTKIIGYTGDGWYEYAETICDNGYLIGIHYYRQKAGWRIGDICTYSGTEFADEGDWIITPVELAMEWYGLRELTDEEIDTLHRELDYYE